MPMRQTLGCNCGLHMRIHQHIKQSFEASRAVDDPTTCAKSPTRSPLTLLFFPRFRCAGRSLLPPGAGRGGPRLPRGWQVSRQGPVRDLSRAANRPASRAKSNARERGKLTLLSRRHQQSSVHETIQFVIYNSRVSRRLAPLINQKGGKKNVPRARPGQL
jgi:hypothetical protein